MEIISEAREREPPIIRAHLLKKKRREVKVDPCLVVNGRCHVWWSMEDPMLGGQWKIPCLVVMEDPMLSGQWKIPCLVVNGMWRKNPFSPLPIPPNNFTLTFNFFL
jgi:hypothetical protein